MDQRPSNSKRHRRPKNNVDGETPSLTPTLASSSASMSKIDDSNSATFSEGINTPALEFNQGQTGGGRYKCNRDFFLQLMQDMVFRNVENQAVSRSMVLGDLQVNRSLSQGGVGTAAGPNAGTLPSKLTDPNDEQTEAQKGIGERAGSPPRNDDIGNFITGVSQEPISISGRFGDVFTAIHKMVGKIALKRLRVGDTNKDNEALHSFEREANTWRRLQHPHVLEFLGTYKWGEHLYLVTPFVENGTLLKYIETHPSINRVRLLCETSEAIDYLHRERIVHGDIKAKNILIGFDGHVLLSDFGLTKLAFAQIFLPLKGIGSARWQSPELLEGKPKTFASDVYAFSMTIAEVLSGAPPFPHLPGDTAVILAVHLHNERPEKAPMESKGVSYKTAWQVAEACWSKMPDDRVPMSDAVRLLKGDPSFA